MNSKFAIITLVSSVFFFCERKNLLLLLFYAIIIFIDKAKGTYCFTVMHLFQIYEMLKNQPIVFLIILIFAYERFIEIPSTLIFS